MKKWMLVVSLVTASLFAHGSYAEEVPSENEAENAHIMPLVTEIPTEEKAFAAVINQFNKQKIVELLGEPAKANDIKAKGSAKVVASIWHYHNINTDENGTYYPTTELDFVEDKVVQVVFLNNGSSEANDGASKKHAEPPMPAMEKLEEIPAAH